MIKKILFALLAIPMLAIQFSAVAYYADTDITGTWTLKAYVYNPSGTTMNFKFVSGVGYSFKSDLSGTISSATGTTPFTWTIKKKTITITESGTTHTYRIVQCSPSELLIVDKNAGTDENGSYTANEKGLMFSK